MKPESRLLGQALLDHLRLVTKQHPPGRRIIVDLYLIPYGELCTRAGVPHVLGVVGAFLLDIAEWCEAADYPPLNALAVNAKTRIPGDAYDRAGGFLLTNWPRDVEACIRFASYPQTMP